MRRMSSDVAMGLEHVKETIEDLERRLNAGSIRRPGRETEKVLPAGARVGEITDVHGGEAEIEMHVRGERVGLHGATQLVHRFVAPAEPSQRLGDQQAALCRFSLE